MEDGRFDVRPSRPREGRSPFLPRRAMKYSRLLALQAALLALAACATARTAAGPGRETLLSDAPAPAGRNCRVAAEPAQLPAAARLVDSAAFSAAVAGAWRQAGGPAGHVLLAMAYDETGVNVRRSLIEHRLPPELAERVADLAFTHRLRVDPAERGWGVRLRIDMAEQPVFRVGRRELCAAQPRDRWVTGFAAWGGTLVDVRERTASGAMLPMSGRIFVRVTLDANGNVTDARVERAPMLRGALEHRVLGYVFATSFLPATEDAEPVPSQLVLPLHLTP